MVHDSEFLGLLDALPADLPRVISWVDEDDAVPEGATRSSH